MRVHRHWLPAAGLVIGILACAVGAAGLDAPHRGPPMGGQHLSGITCEVCHDGVVAYEGDEQAREEAAAHLVSEDEAERLREQCARKAAELGGERRTRPHSQFLGHGMG